MPNDAIDLSDIHVLIIDDEPLICEMLVVILKQIGIGHIDEAKDGGEGLTKISSTTPDLIILDIMMAPMNGLQFLKTLRIGLSGAPFDLPVLVLTSSDDEAILSAAMALDCDAFVKKNIGPQAIQDHIENVLKEKAAVKEPSAYHAVKIPKVTLDLPSLKKTESTSPSSPAREIAVIDAEIGMIMDRDLHSDDGHLLLPQDTILTSSHVNRLCDLSEILELHHMWVRDS